MERVIELFRKMGLRQILVTKNGLVVITLLAESYLMYTHMKWYFYVHMVGN